MLLNTQKTNWRLVALDIDGTMVGTGNMSLTQHTRTALVRLQQNGVRLALVSGRPLASMRQFISQLKLDTYNGCLCSCNGAEILDAATGNTLLQRFMPVEDICLLQALAQANYPEVNISIYSDDTLITQKRDNYAILDAMYNNMVLHIAPDFTSAVTCPAPKCMITGPTNPVHAFATWLGKNESNRFAVIPSNPAYAEVTAAGVDKGTGLEVLLHHYGLSAQQTVAFGDSLNDLPLFKAAGRRVAMHNACHEILDVADDVAPPADDDGVAAMLYKMDLL